MGSHIQRFFESNHAPLHESDWVGFAMDDARSWVESVNPNEWNSVNGFYDRSADKGNCIALIAEIGMAFSRPWGITWTGTRSGTGRGDAGAYDEALSKYRNAWLAYYRHLRRREEQLMAERHQERMADLEAGWRSRPEPALPPHLRYLMPAPYIWARLIGRVEGEPPVSRLEALRLRHPRICRQIPPKRPGELPDPGRGVPRSHECSGEGIGGREKFTGTRTGIIARSTQTLA